MSSPASGIDWANNVSQWLAYKPTDPLNQLAAEAHVYAVNVCNSTSCFDAQMAPVAARVPPGLRRGGRGLRCLRREELLDAHELDGSARLRYMAWVWNTWGTCMSLINDWAGTPRGVYGSWVRRIT
jgi:hypothetical protein